MKINSDKKKLIKVLKECHEQIQCGFPDTAWYLIVNHYYNLCKSKIQKKDFEGTDEYHSLVNHYLLLFKVTKAFKLAKDEKIPYGLKLDKFTLCRIFMDWIERCETKQNMYLIAYIMQQDGWGTWRYFGDKDATEVVQEAWKKGLPNIQTN